MPMWKTWGAVAVSVGVGLLPGAVRADELPSRDTIVLLQPVNRLGVGVEHAVGTHVALVASLTANFYLLGARLEEPAPSGTGLWSVGFDPGVHVYLAGHAPNGFWVGAHLESELSQSGSRGTVLGEEGPREYSLSSSTYSLGGSARVGYTAILSPGLTLQVGLGVGVLETRLWDDEISGAVGEGVSSGLGTLLSPAWIVAPRMSLGLGWAF